MRHPHALAEASPTTVELLRVCGLRVALSQTRQHPAPSSPWARLGIVCHAMFEQAAEGHLGDGGEDFTERFEAAWATAVAEQERNALASPVFRTASGHVAGLRSRSSLAVAGFLGPLGGSKPGRMLCQRHELHACDSR